MTSPKSTLIHVWRRTDSGPELWKIPPVGTPVVVTDPAKKCQRLVVASPTRSLLCMPLWVASQGNPRDLAELELTSRRLVRKGCRVESVPVEVGADRSLLLAVVASDDSSLDAHADRAWCFEAPARLWGAHGRDLMVWREESTLCFAFYRADRCVYFSTAGDLPLGLETADGIFRCALRLVAEEVITANPAQALLLGTFSEEEFAALARHMSVEGAPIPAPSLPVPPLDFPPPKAVAARAKRKRTARLAVGAAIATALYLVLLSFIAGDLALRALRQQEIEAKVRAQNPSAERARTEVLRWQVIRRAINPPDFLLDVLASVVRTIPADNMRLTQFTFEAGMILISGEAADVGQSYEMLERLKAQPSLAEYEWSARPPQIAGQGAVRFEMEGRKSDAHADTD